MAAFDGDDLFEVVLRVLVKGPGTLLVRLFGGSPGSSDRVCWAAGFALWGVLLGGGWLAFTLFGPS